MMDITVQKQKKTRKRCLQDENNVSKKKTKLDDYAVEEINKNATTNIKSNLKKDDKQKHVNSNGIEIQDGFNGETLRILFSSSNGLDAVRKFLTICNENKEKDLVSEYLLAGGNVLEVLKLLDSTDKKNTSNANIVFSAINILLMRILAQYPEYQNNAVEACRYLINSYMSTVHSMLSSQSNTKQRKVVLKLLAAIVSLGGNLSRELLAHLSLQQETLESLVRQSKPTDPQSVRTHFIHFILAFLVEGNTSVIRTLLDKRGLLSSIFPDLLYDSKDIVNLVLTTVKMYVLENMSISKTTKLHVFSTYVVLNLVSLYDWKGPSNWRKNKTSGIIESEEFKEDKEIVNEVVHEFLIVLLTSHRYGLIFHDRTLNSRNKHNQLVHTVLQSLKKPWEHERLSDLVVKIMGVCPDLIRSQYDIVEPFLEPRISPKWIVVLSFVKKIIESVNPDTCIKTCSKTQPHKYHLINNLLTLTVPSKVINNAIVPGLKHESLLIRHESLTLLLAMVQQVKAISLSTRNFYEIHTIQDRIMEFILKIFPSLESILQTWNRVFENETEDTSLESPENFQIPTLLDHLDIILSVLYAYNDICPNLLNNSTDLRPTVLLSHLNSLENENEEKLNSMKIKAIQFLLALDSSIFVPGQKIFKKTLLFLISLISQEDSHNNKCVRDTIRILLNATSLFEACSEQLDIWIEGFATVTDPTEKQELTQWFMLILKSAIKHSDKYMNRIMQAKEIVSKQMTNFDVKKAEDITNDLFEEFNKSCGQSTDANATCELSNGFIDNPQEESLKNNIKYIDKRTNNITDLDVKQAVEIIHELFNEAKKTGNDNSLGFSSALSFLFNGQSTGFDGDRNEDIINNTFDKSRENIFAHCRMQASTSMSPLLCCVLQKIAEENAPAIVSSYLSYVIVHVLHDQVTPGLLLHIATDLTTLPIYKYLQGWSTDRQPARLKSKHASLKIFCKLSAALLLDSKMDISKVFDGNVESRFKYDDQEIIIKHYLSQYNLQALLKMSVFYLAQLAQRGILQPVQNENCKLALVSLLNIAQAMDPETVAIVEDTARCIFTHPILLHYFSPLLKESAQDSVEAMITSTVLEICKVVTQLQEKHDVKFCNIFFAFRKKFLMQLRHAIEKNSLEICKSNCNVAIALLEILQLRIKDVASLLQSLMTLEKTRFISADKQNLSMFGHLVPILLDMYCKKSRPAGIQNDMLNDQFVARLSLHLVHLKSSKINDVQKWEEAFSRHLAIFPHNIAGISTDTFALLLMRGISRSTIQLITTMIARNTRLIPSLVKYLLKMEKQGEVVFPILQSNLEYKWNEKFLRNLYEHYSDDITTHLIEPQNPVSWIEANVAAVAYLIKNTFDLALCEKICDNIAQSGDKLELVSIYYVQLLESLYKRYESLATIKKKPLTDLIKILLHIITSTLKKESKNLEKINVLCEKLDNAVVYLRKDKRDFVINSLSKSYSWPQFTRFSLKMGLKDAKDDTTKFRILKTLSNLCDIAYEDNIDDDYARTLFEMTTSHSEFANVMLDSSTVKGALVELLWVLIRKSHSVMIVTHVPLYLAAYNATLSETDQRILRILQHYETHNIRIQQYWPYFWGNAAAIRYGVKGEIDTALWRQPAASEIFDLLDKNIVNETIKNYPVHRASKDDELYETSNVYDPAFYLPLLCSMLIENNLVACHKVTQSGALALILAACSSDSSDIRMTAYTAISRYYFHLEASRPKEKLLWMRLIDALRNGIMSLQCPLADVRLSCLVSTFLARASLVATQPLHPLYSPLHTFLMAKPALDLNTIPELLQLLHSSHVEHKAHRHWILKNIRDGIKVESDVDVALKCVLFKMLLDFHTCVLADTKSKKLILEIIASTTKISKTALLLLRGYGLLPWLHKTVACLNSTETIDTIVTIIENLLNSLNSLTEDTGPYKFLLFSILAQLRVHFVRSATNDLYIRYVKIIQRLFNAKDAKNRQSIEKILGTNFSWNTHR